MTIAANKDITFATGSGIFDMTLATGDFVTGTGAVKLKGSTTITTGNSFTTGTGNAVISGDMTIAANKDITFATGSGIFDMTLATGDFLTGSGAVKLKGSTTI